LADRTLVASTVYDTLTALWPGRFEGHAIGEQESLGSDGIGLDSIEIVELLLACEERLGNGWRADELLESGPIRIGSLIDHLAEP
jgi:acyl carrier protein